MRIWIVNQYAVAPDQPGGVRPFALAKELVRRGHEVTVAASSFNHWTRSETRLSEGEDVIVENVQGVRFVWLRTPPYPGSTVRRFFSMLQFGATVLACRTLKSLDPPDVVVGSNPHLFGALASQLIAERCGAGFVFEVRDIWPQSLVDYGRLSQKHPAIKLLSAIERRLVSRAGAIVALMPSAEPHMLACGAKTGSYFWIPNGVDLSDLPPPSPLRVSKPFTVIFAGIHGIANGLDTVLDAAQLMEAAGLGDDVLFRFVGDGGEKPRLVKRAGDMGLNNVRFDPPVPKSEIPRVLAESDAGLMILKSSPVFRWGISPNKLFDYFGAARPVVFSVESANNPVADADAGVTVVPEDAQSLAAGVTTLMQTPLERRREMGENGRAYVSHYHDLGRLGEKLEQAVQRAAESSPVFQESFGQT